MKFYPVNFLSCVNDYIEDMVTFTALVKIYSIEYFCNTKVAGVGEIFVQWKFCRIRYIDEPVVEIYIMWESDPKVLIN